jgi:hypothetical protein
MIWLQFPSKLGFIEQIVSYRKAISYRIYNLKETNQLRLKIAIESKTISPLKIEMPNPREYEFIWKLIFLENFIYDGIMIIESLPGIYVKAERIVTFLY